MKFVANKFVLLFKLLTFFYCQPDGEIEGLQARLQDAERALKQARDRASQVHITKSAVKETVESYKFS